MASLKTLAIVYVLGGLTFVPLVVLVVLSFAVFTLPRRDVSGGSSQSRDDLSRSLDEDLELKSVPEKLKRSHEPDLSAGYFAVCREYVPGGVNGKPPERTTPAGEIIAAESPSVYQSMYRSIFDRNKTASPVLEGSKPKRARNVFYVVLRHGHLMLFDDSEQLEVRYVIALMHYEVDIYAGGQEIPEGELWIKRNCIRLVKKEQKTTAPFYLFSDNCSDKEDFYHILLRNQAREPGAGTIPSPLRFDTDDMIKLVRQLHGSEDTFQSRWINAMIGRIFLALYKTSDVEEFVRCKVNKKISRVSKPAFITSLQLQEVDLGNSAPVITNPKLRELTVEGDLTIEADIKYNGNFKLQIAAVARIDLGSRFKVREVDLVLAGIFKKLEGHMLFRVKPPPSNRIWYTFETMPKIDISIEPIVSARQITYGFVLRAIESRIREVFGETLVLPNWDDSSFTNTASQHYRGGIWDSNRSTKLAPEPTSASQETFDETANLPTEAELESLMSLEAHDKTESKTSRPGSRIGRHQDFVPEGEDSTDPAREVDKPKALRSNSFATVATPVVSRGSTTTDTRKLKKDRDATSAMKILSKSSEASPLNSPVGSPGLESKLGSKEISTLFESPFKPNESLERDPGSPKQSIDEPTEPLSIATDEGPISKSSITDDILKSNLNSREKMMQINSSLSIATAAAKKWGLGVLARQNESRSATDLTRDSDRLKPIGRGQPLPPPGVPLPRPPGSAWSVPVLNPLKKRQDTIPPALPARPTRKPVSGIVSPRRSMTTPPLNPKYFDDGRDENLMVVSAPTDSAPASPATEETLESKELSIPSLNAEPLEQSVMEPSQIPLGEHATAKDEDESFDAWEESS